MTEQEKLVCPDGCGQEFERGGFGYARMARHRKAAHGVQPDGPVRRKKRETPQETPSVVQPPVYFYDPPQEPLITSATTAPTPSVVHVSDSLQDYLALKDRMDALEEEVRRLTASVRVHFTNHNVPTPLRGVH